MLALVFAATRPLPGGLLPFAPARRCSPSGRRCRSRGRSQPDRSWAYANRGLVYLAFALVGAFAADRLRELMFGLAAILGAVCAWSLAGKALPWLYEDYERIARLRAPIGYWNALALLGAIALPIGALPRDAAARARDAARLRLDRRDRADVLARRARSSPCSSSRAWMVLSRAWAEALATLVAAGVPAAVVIAVAFALDGVTSDGQSHSTRVSDGAIFGLVAARGARRGRAARARAAAGAGRRRSPRGARARRRARRGGDRRRRDAGGLVVGLVHEPDRRGAPELAQTASPTPGSNYRWTWWKQAWRALGGASRGRDRRGLVRVHEPAATAPRASTRTTEPHSLPVQFLTRDRDRRARCSSSSRRPASSAPPAGDPGRSSRSRWRCPRTSSHGLVDIGWDFAAVSAPGLPDRGRGRRPARPGAAALGARPCSSAAASRSRSSARSSRSGSATAGRGRPTRRSTTPTAPSTLAKRARSINPLAVEPLFAQAYAEQRRGNLGEALGLFQEATRLQPENREAWYLLGVFDLRVRNCPRAALPRARPLHAARPAGPGQQGVRPRV